MTISQALHQISLRTHFKIVEPKVQTYLSDGATIEFAALCITLVPINRMKAALSCSRTYLTLVPVKTCNMCYKNGTPASSSSCSKGKHTRGQPFSEAIRSDIQVRDSTSSATASNCAPCLSMILGTCQAFKKTIRINYIIKVINRLGNVIVYQYFRHCSNSNRQRSR